MSSNLGATRSTDHTPPAPEIEAWLIQRLATLLGISADEINPDADIDEYGLDSILAIAIIDELGTWLNRKINPRILEDYPSIASLAEYLSTSG
ncbi:MAG TPA: acyl carrier protein [Kamptonema sp.]|nr:acyl carrier protein [Kamptonema sp.]